MRELAGFGLGAPLVLALGCAGTSSDEPKVWMKGGGQVEDSPDD